MKIGIVLPTHMYDPKRRELADAGFKSLAKTEPLIEESRLLILARRGHAHEYTPYVDMLNKSFKVILRTDEQLEGTEQTLAFGTQWLTDNFDLDYITWMGDDALFHPMWLWKLEGLIRRRPNAIAWSVYRSAHEAFHLPLQFDGDDVLVRSICGHGMTFKTQEWKDWGIDWKTGAWGCHQGDTLDLVHSETRPGERWVTKQSYIQHTGKVGKHCTGPEIPEYAQEFAGTE